MARATLRIRTNAKKVSRKLSRADRELERAFAQGMKELQVPVLEAFRAEAVGGSEGGLARGLQVDALRVRGHGFEVVSTFRDPNTGFDPLGVTRFGHRKKWITPDDVGRGVSAVVATRSPRGPRRVRSALRIATSDGVIYRYRVRGFRPAGDWVVQGRNRAHKLASAELGRLGRKVTARIL